MNMSLSSLLLIVVIISVLLKDLFSVRMAKVRVRAR
jgi:hypothetical protein